MSYKHLKRGNLELIFQHAITLGTVEEEKILFTDSVGLCRRSKAKQVFTCVFSEVLLGE